MGGEDGERTPEEIAREHERIQREIENRARSTEGGLTRADIAKVARQEQEADVLRVMDERWGREGMRLDPEPQPAESIMDEIDTTQASTGVMGGAPDEAPVLTGGMRDALRRPENMIRLFAAGLGIIGLLVLMLGLRAELRAEANEVPGGAIASPPAASPPATATASAGASATPAASVAASPITQVPPPVTGTATANASFTKVSGPCSFAAEFTDRYEFAATDGALTLTQLSNGHESRGSLDSNGDFTTMADGQGYRGNLSGTTATGQHTYTAEGCNEVYDFTMQLSEPLLPAATIAPSPTIQPTVGPSPTTQPAPTGTQAATPSAGPTSGPALSTGGGGPNIALSALGFFLLVSAIGLFFGGPRLAGGPVIAEPLADDDPCARGKARLAAAEQARDAADERLRQIEDLERQAQTTRRDSAAKQEAAAEAARGASSYQGADGKPVYTNAAQRARIEAADAAAAASRAAADAAQRAYDAAGGGGGRQAAADEVFRAHREHGDAKAALDACLRMAAAAAPTPAPRPSGGGTTTGGTGVGVGTGTSDGTRTRSEPACTKGEKRNETTTEHRFFMHDVGNAQITAEGTKLNSDDSDARRFLQHLGRLDDAFKAGKIGSALAGGEIVGPLLDAIEFPDFLTYFGAIREQLDATMERLLEDLRRNRRQAAYTIRYTTHYFLLTCRKWEECDGERFVWRSETNLALLRSAAASLGPEMLTDEESRRRWLDGWLNRLRRSSDEAQRRADEFRQGCGQ